MFLVWHGSMHRPTSDIDLLGFLEPDEANLAGVIRSVCIQEVDDDGVIFDPNSVVVERIRAETALGGLRCLMHATLGSAKLRVQLDIGFGDDVSPEPELVEVPRLLADEVRRELMAYTPETVIAEKFEAIVKLGLANSRMKDYLDLDLLLGRDGFNLDCLAEALRRTFKRRNTPLPDVLPVGLTTEFWSDETALRRWQAFVRVNRLTVGSLEEVSQRLSQRIVAALELARDG
jgi:hypothetical protein